MSSVCGTDMMNGCGGRLCTVCRPVLKRFQLRRYPLDAAGAPLTGETPEEYIVCGFTASIKSAGIKDKLDLPGRMTGGMAGLRLTVVGCSCGSVAKGDRVEADGEWYRVAVVQRGTPSVAVLVPVQAGGAAK